MEHNTHIHTWIKGEEDAQGNYTKECSNCHVVFRMNAQDVVIGVIDRRKGDRRQ